MKIIRSPKQMQKTAWRWRAAGRSVGLVPTMGCFHEGHLSLFRRARRENDIVVVSVFVNPAQFGPREDFAHYPRPWKRDRRLAGKCGVDVVFHPSAKALYAKGHQTWVDVEELSRPLCGAFRPGHFRGVATVVAKLFQLVQPARAYFGRKDFQQLRIVQKMAADLNFPVRVVPCPTVRERDGLAMSSRNAYLSAEQRRRAAGIPRALQSVGEVIKFSSQKPISPTVILRKARALLRRIPGARPDYVELVDPRSLRPLKKVAGRALVATAVRLGRARLIDNRLVGRE
ncbi:MAG TPA: pantoate--beta-alanine ligase [Elusimicrobiota bacterium]|nr:pantoate--beta-alanine ligase [Elusimicrobiota bacterium]